jgi:hypothetical protein
LECIVSSLITFAALKYRRQGVAMETERAKIVEKPNQKVKRMVIQGQV